MPDYNAGMTSTDWKTALNEELRRAEAARARGNEGQARVCARRAAGIAIREYLRRRGTPVSDASAYRLLTLLRDSPELAPDLREAAAHLTLRVTEAFTLPVDTDLIAEARKLCAALLPDWESKAA